MSKLDASCSSDDQWGVPQLHAQEDFLQNCPEEHLAVGLPCPSGWDSRWVPSLQRGFDPAWSPLFVDSGVPWFGELGAIILDSGILRWGEG